MDTIKKISAQEYIELIFTGGEKAKFAFGNQGDLFISNPNRKAEGRALVVERGNKLVVNYNNDFDIVEINGLELKSIFSKLEPVPAGVKTFDIVVDSQGKVYKKT